DVFRFGIEEDGGRVHVLRCLGLQDRGVARSGLFLLPLFLLGSRRVRLQLVNATVRRRGRVDGAIGVDSKRLYLKFLGFENDACFAVWRYAIDACRRSGAHGGMTLRLRPHLPKLS